MKNLIKMGILWGVNKMNKEFDFVNYLDDFIKGNLSYKVNCGDLTLEEITSIIQSFKDSYLFYRLYLTKINSDIANSVADFCKKFNYSYSEEV